MDVIFSDGLDSQGISVVVWNIINSQRRVEIMAKKPTRKIKLDSIKKIRKKLIRDDKKSIKLYEKGIKRHEANAKSLRFAIKKLKTSQAFAKSEIKRMKDQIEKKEKEIKRREDLVG